VAGERPEVLARMKKGFLEWQRAVEESVAGKDYPEGKVREGEPKSRHWSDDPRYEKYFEEWKKRPEYEGVLRRK